MGPTQCCEHCDQVYPHAFVQTGASEIKVSLLSRLRSSSPHKKVLLRGRDAL